MVINPDAITVVQLTPSLSGWLAQASHPYCSLWILKDSKDMRYRCGCKMRATNPQRPRDYFVHCPDCSFTASCFSVTHCHQDENTDWSLSKQDRHPISADVNATRGGYLGAQPSLACGLGDAKFAVFDFFETLTL